MGGFMDNLEEKLKNIEKKTKIPIKLNNSVFLVNFRLDINAPSAYLARLRRGDGAVKIYLISIQENNKKF
jgi:hypothetical protein